MSGNDFLIDTNILIYLQNGLSTIDTILKDKNLYVSFISQMEILSYQNISQQQLYSSQRLLDECFIIEMNQDIKARAIEIRRIAKLKLPDAIIAATSVLYELPIITADKGFSKVKGLDLFLISA